MELIQTDHNLIEKQSILNFNAWDLVSGLSSEYEANDFQLSMPETVWNEMPVIKGHYLYEPGTEWGGRVEGIAHINGEIQLKGATWRGLLARKIVSPPALSAYKVITSIDANTAISTLVGTSFGELIKVKSESAGVNVSGQFRYTNLLSAIHTMLDQYGLRLKVEFDGKTVWLSAEAVTDLSDESELSQDYSAPVESSQDESQAYNHVIALGSGELVDREVIELYRDDAGTISTTPLPEGIEDKQIVLDFPNAESTEELTKAATDKLIETAPVSEVSIDLSEAQGLNLGDLVGGRDRITNLQIVKPITQIIRRVDSSGESIEYKVGE
jgi:hypothetical protein